MAKHDHGRHGRYSGRHRPAHTRPPARRRALLILSCWLALVGALMALPYATATSGSFRFIARADADLGQAKPNSHFGTSRTLRTSGFPEHAASTTTSTRRGSSTSTATPNTTKPPAGSTVPSGFVYRDGKTLMLAGRPYKFAGFNAYGMSGCETGSAWSRSMLDDYFSNLPAASMTRTWAFSAYGSAALDQIVASAAAHNQKLILSLADGNSNCRDYDGSPGGEGTGKNTSWYVSGYKIKYLNWVRTVVSRYKDSPAVGMWEIINEPGHTGGKVDDTTMRAFFDAAAATIKGIDQRHLVESGALGEYVSGTTDYAYVHGGPNVDVGSLHEYEYDHSNAIVSEHFSPTLTAMNSIDKPLIVGETGILAGPDCQTSPDTRAEAVKKKLDAYLRGGAVGVAVWNRSSRSYPGCDYGFGPDDPLNATIKSYVV
jgi:mannan endo-1,4-beta-mannosidase